MSDLVTFLRACLDEDERAAHDVAKIGLDTLMPAAIIDRSGATVFFVQEVYERVTAALDPTRLLADVAAKRAILDLHAVGGTPPLAAFDECRECVEPWPCQTIRLLATPFADRPGYDESWRV